MSLIYRFLPFYLVAEGGFEPLTFGLLFYILQNVCLLTDINGILNITKYAIKMSFVYSNVCANKKTVMIFVS